jgi:hypothetical protein
MAPSVPGCVVCVQLCIFVFAITVFTTVHFRPLAASADQPTWRLTPDTSTQSGMDFYLIIVICLLFLFFYAQRKVHYIVQWLHYGKISFHTHTTHTHSDTHSDTHTLTHTHHSHTHKHTHTHTHTTPHTTGQRHNRYILGKDIRTQGWNV